MLLSKRIKNICQVLFLTSFATYAFDLKMETGKLTYCQDGSTYESPLVSALPQKKAAITFTQQSPCNLENYFLVNVEITPLEGDFYGKDFVFFQQSGSENFSVELLKPIDKLKNENKVTLRFMRPGNWPDIADEFRLCFNLYGNEQRKSFQIHRISFEKGNYVKSIPMQKHQRVFGRTFFYSQMQTKYNWYQNYLDIYNNIIFRDRPFVF